jgi:hypothetical protein
MEEMTVRAVRVAVQVIQPDRDAGLAGWSPR